MTNIFKSIVAFFLLVIFLFPNVERGLHGYSHKDDTHCTSTTEKHFHTQEHDCSICDFIINISDTPIKSNYSFVAQTFNLVFAVQIPISATSSACAYFFSLRGPPTIS